MTTRTAAAADTAKGSSAPIVVVGAGILGTTTAIALARRGHRVTVLERAIPGAEASIAAAGMLAPQTECTEGGSYFALCLEGLRTTQAWCEEARAVTGIDPELRRQGHLHVAATDVEARALAAKAAWQTALGVRAELVDDVTAREILPALGSAPVRGLYFADEASLDTRKYGAALQAWMRAVGVDVRSGATTTGLAFADGRCVGVHVARDGSAETIAAAHVVVCAGAWSSRVEGAGVGVDDVYPVRGQMLELRADRATLRTTLHGNGGYLVPRDDGRVIVGSTMERVGFEKAVTACGIAKLLACAISLIPALGDAVLSSTWCGLRPATRDGLPLLGETAVPGLWLNTGHFRNGILLAAISGEAVADLVDGRAPRVEVAPFSPLRGSARER